MLLHQGHAVDLCDFQPSITGKARGVCSLRIAVSAVEARQHSIHDAKPHLLGKEFEGVHSGALTIRGTSEKALAAAVVPAAAAAISA